MSQVFIAGAQRTPIGEFRKGLASLPASELAAVVIRHLVAEYSLKEKVIDEVILGNVVQGGGGMNPARQAAVSGGLPYSIPAYTVNMVCASGLHAILLAGERIRAGSAKMILAGGMESMSRAPHALLNIRKGVPLGVPQIQDLLIADGLWDAFYDCHMSDTVEQLISKYGITRGEQDAYAVESHRRATLAQRSGLFDDEIVPIRVQDELLAHDERPRADTSIERLAALHPAFRKDGTITAGNASGLNDGAGVAIVSAEKLSASAGPQAIIEGSVIVGVDPMDMGVSPVLAIKRLLAEHKLGMKDIDLWELNEAFAGQVLAVLREIEIPLDSMNVNGGAIALGHPIGCSGARILITLIHEMERRELELGIAALCVGGGLGIAVLVRRTT